MQHAELDDAALLRLARDGSAPAYATIVYRQLPTVTTVLDTVNDRDRAVVAVFARSMRGLDAATEPLDDWFTAQAQTVASQRQFRRQVTADRDGDRQAVEPTAVWRELAPRWPNGRRPLRIPTAVSWVATVIVTIALSIAVPWITLGQFEHDEVIPSLRAFPIDAHRDGPAYDPTEVPEREPLPTFEFPVPPEASDDPPGNDEPPTSTPSNNADGGPSNDESSEADSDEPESSDNTS